MEGLWAFALTSFLIELTPGPNMAYLAILAATEGRRPGFAAVGGVALGLGIVGALSALGVAALIAASEPLYQALRWGGVAYLLWLAWEGWRDGEAGPELAPAGSSDWRYFRRGLVTNLLNPKAAAFYIAVLPTFLPPGAGVHDTLLLSAVYVAVATGVHGAIVALAGAARALFEDARRERLLRRTLSLALAGVALWFAWKTGR
ncbi:MAG: LysE family translocator [Paracoccaceae bacterium]|jgi:threonine/homoserine/homoserine lactone efflux protein